MKTLSQPVFRYSLLAVLFAVVPNLVGAVIAFLLFTFLGWLDLPNGSVLLYWRQAIGLTLTFLPVLAATLAWARFRERQPVDLRLQGSTTTRFAVGAIAGLAMCAGMVVLLVTPGGATFERTVAASSPLVTVALLAAMMGILIQTGAEEVIFRGWLLSRLQNTLTPTRAAIVSSLVFAAVHLFTNPSVMAFIGLFLYGVLLAMVRLHGGGLAAAIGWHWAWNFSESALFGVSERTASSISTAVIGSITDTGNPLWSGGMHGTNSGLAMILVLAAGCLLFATKFLVAKSRVLDSHGAA